MLIAEELILLTLEDITGQPVKGLRNLATRDVLVGGALLAELALAGAAEVHQQSFWRSPKVRPVKVQVADDASLQHAYDIVCERPRTPPKVVKRIGTGMAAYLIGHLVDQGLLRAEDRKGLFFSTTVHPVLDPRSKQPVRDRIAGVLLHGHTPDERTGTLIALLSAVDQAHRLFVSPTVPPRVVKKRAKEIARADWAAGAVREVIIAARQGVESGFSDSGGDGGGDGGGGGGD